MSALAFELPAALEAREPPEARGTARDGVALLVARRAARTISHHVFSELPELLAPGDVVVINVSATLPAAIAAHRADGSAVTVHIATRAPRLDERWSVVELRTADGAAPVRGLAGERLELDGGALLELVATYASGPRLLLARLHARQPMRSYLNRFGRPIRYGYVPDQWPLETYQNVYATTPGSAEMPSAGRPFTTDLITALAARGVLIAPLLLHAGVSSPESHEPPFPEPYSVPGPTACVINDAHRRGGRVLAVGTTVVRALESVAAVDGTVTAGEGWTSLVIGPERRLRAVDALLTGWHEPNASHLQMLEAAAGFDLLERSYGAALERGYRWHEFGDSHLILP